MLAELGVTLADLHRAQRPRVPTMAEYLPQVMAAAGPGTRRTYATYWRRMATVWGDRALDSITASDVEALQRQVAATASRDATAATAGMPASSPSPQRGRSMSARSPTGCSNRVRARPTGSRNPAGCPASGGR